MPKLDELTGLKKCSLCKEEKTREYFYRSNYAVDGLTYQCIECTLKSQKESKSVYRRKNREKLRKAGRLYMKEKLKDPLFKKRRNEYSKIYYHKNKKRLNRLRVLYAKNSPVGRAINFRHQKKRNGVIMAFPKILRRDLTDLYLRSGDRCFYCFYKLNGIYEFDHYIPLSKGGSHTIDNLRISCKRCNRTKLNKMPEEFFNNIFPKMMGEVYHRVA